ncbi:MAG: SMP-30/gluconolactonase/LRE family protein [Ilumatobacteraceae bacterium]
MTTIEIAGSVTANLGESPVWSGAEQVLYWVDIEGRAVHRYDPSCGETESRALPGRPGSLAMTGTQGRLLVAQEHELVWLDFDSGRVEPWIELEEPGSGNRLNDGRTDPAGRFVVGSMFADTSAGRTTGRLHQIEATGDVSLIREDVGIANGLAFDPVHDRAYFADTPTQRVVVWDYDAATGQRTNERPFLDYAEVPGLPDGGCVDADGCYWSASVYGFAVIRVTPDGRLDRRIEVPAEKPSMPAFGGPDLTTLFVTTIGVGGTMETEAPDDVDGVPAGSLLAIDAGVQGLPEPAFAVP